MIDYFALALCHALILIALARILTRPELDREDPLALIAPGDEEDVAEPEDAPSPRDRKRARRLREATGTPSGKAPRDA